MIRTHIAPAGALAAMLFVCGCAPNAANVDVTEQWSDAMARLDMLALYPLREDAQIGDVFLISTREADPDLNPRFRTLRIGAAESCDLEDMLLRQESSRLAIRWTQPSAGGAAPVAPAPAATATATLTVPGTVSVVARPAPAARATTTVTERAPESPCPQRVAAARTGRRSPPPPRPALFVQDVGGTASGQPRLRRVAVPGLVASSLTAAQIGAAGPVADIAGALGFNSSRHAAVTIRLRNLVSMSIDENIAMDNLERLRMAWARANLPPTRLIRYVHTMDEDAASRLCRARSSDLERLSMFIALANSIIYARRVEYEFSQTRTQALLGGASLAALFAQVSPAPIPTVPAAVPATVGGAADPGALAAQLRAAQVALAESLPTSPGARLSLGVGSFGGLSLAEDFPTPVAVGMGTPVYFTVARSLFIAATSQDVADREMNRALHTCGRILNPPGETQTPRPLRNVHELICRNSREAQRIEAIELENPPASFLPRSCDGEANRLTTELLDPPGTTRLVSEPPVQLPPSTVSPARVLRGQRGAPI
ncbi:hypothetical protein [Roseomonas sp. CECT 9278]|uniref:hypothetical protein n=1 Tax=Roseomonas sp. CECT 9278 TaxID=2845823 RepID=UPI001E5F03BD|nr:hypothetical protein [Roseomonas sp. CECT 9278]CAH0289241.1 hypothetical protein ROS9278_04178 [Roseomonas sp. CECT 9278]